LNSQIAAANKVIRDNTLLLNITIVKIKQTKVAIEDAKKDEATARKNLATENANYAKITEHHKEMISELNKEVGIVDEVVNKLHSHGIS